MKIMLATVRELSSSSSTTASWPFSSNFSSHFPSSKTYSRPRSSSCRANLGAQRKLASAPRWKLGLCSQSSETWFQKEVFLFSMYWQFLNPWFGLIFIDNSCESSKFDPLGINLDTSTGLNVAPWESVLGWLTQKYESTSSTRKEKPSSARGVAAAIEDTSIDFGDFFKGPLPGKFLKLLGYLALSRLGVYIPLGGVNREAFVGNLDQNSLLSTLDSFSGGGIGRLGICSLGIVPFINAQIVFQLLAQIYPKLQELQKREGEAGRKKILQYTRYASVGFAIVQAIGQVLYLRPYVNDFSTDWALSSVTLLTLGSVLTTYIGERISDLKLGNGTSLLIFTSIISYLPASFGRTVAQAFQDGNYIGLVAIILSFFLLVLSIVYVQEAERKIPINYASRYASRTGGLQRSAYLPFKDLSSGKMIGSAEERGLIISQGLDLSSERCLAVLRREAFIISQGLVILLDLSHIFDPPCLLFQILKSCYGTNG
ncbi:preprotein translocase subunit SCY1, chloroplastic isoform X4 [Diospyros lotus]|uniref:preprotein translocase subunit SCY1, chloroplastic isoform X4 n=1 Tax=Diospyros lotus TaxID=55363 RepID=UPI00224D8945|nr:preprotein translocase subunit SCY1, chloroplastic isoform X4 [Diospyros lotus]